MFKKILLSTLLLCGCVAFHASGENIFSARAKSAAPRKQLYNDKKSAADAVLRSLANRNTDLLWLMLDPATQREAIEECGSAEKAQADLKKYIFEDNAHLMDKIKLLYKDPQSRKNLIETFCSTPDALVKINGQWYLGEGFGKVMEKLEAQPALPDQSSKEAVCQTFAESIISNDMNKFFAIIPPELQKKILAESNNDMALVLKSLQTGFQSGMTEETRQTVKKIMADPELKKVYIDNLVKLANERKAFVYTNGKWYLDTTKFDD